VIAASLHHHRQPAVLNDFSNIPTRWTSATATVAKRIPSRPNTSTLPERRGPAPATITSILPREKSCCQPATILMRFLPSARTLVDASMAGPHAYRRNACRNLSREPDQRPGANRPCSSRSSARTETPSTRLFGRASWEYPSDRPDCNDRSRDHHRGGFASGITHTFRLSTRTPWPWALELEGASRHAHHGRGPDSYCPARPHQCGAYFAVTEPTVTPRRTVVSLALCSDTAGI
jgi:hypothetical protein